MDDYTGIEERGAFSLYLSAELDARPRTYADLAFWQARCAHAGEQVEATLLPALSDEYLIELWQATAAERLRGVLGGELARRRACWFGGHGRVSRRLGRIWAWVRSTRARQPAFTKPAIPKPAIPDHAVAMRTEMANAIGRKRQRKQQASNDDKDNEHKSHFYSPHGREHEGIGVESKYAVRSAI